MTTGILSFDACGPGAVGDFMREWDARIGNRFPLASFGPEPATGFRFRSAGMRVRDVMFNSIDSTSAIRTTGGTFGVEDHVRVWIMRRGVARFGNRREHAVAAGRFTAHGGRLTHFTAAAHSTIQVLALPAGAVPRLRDRTVSGSAGAAEMRLLTAHLEMVRESLAALRPAGVDAARNTLVELAAAAIAGSFDESEPLLAPALARAAEEIADRRLTDPELSPAALARHLNVSVRTLQRAFAAEGRSVSAYIRDRRLEAARRALTTAGKSTTVSELAARLQFADGGHLARAFRKRYRQSPSEYLAGLRRP
jgi:AraC-like DNA-binding protein